MRNLKQHISGEYPRGSSGSRADRRSSAQIRVLGGNMRNLKQHISGECPEEVLGAERTEIPLPGKGTRRKYAELKTAYFRRVPQRKFWEQSGQKILCPGKGTRRKYAELKYRRERTKWQKVRGIITRCSA